jgi:hypothetical protein|nr:MAG TPA: hypothetical protein [Crassvirales sp.]
MCLELLSEKLVAKEDIICYKIVRKRGNKLYTPYQEVEIKPGIFKATGTLSEDRGDRRKTVGEGVIHTFAKYDQALDEKDGKNTLIYKCVIPKGTNYYIGLFEAFLSYGSEIINVLEKCNEDTDKANPVDQNTMYFGDIQSYEDALKYLGRDPIPETGDESVDAFIKLKTIAEAWNKIDGFEVVYDSDASTKYYPYFWKNAYSGFGCCHSAYGVSRSAASVGGRLCFSTSKIAILFGDMFRELYAKYLMLNYPVKRRRDV